MSDAPRPVDRLTSDQRRLLREAVREARRSRDLQRIADKAKESAWRKILGARNSGVPDPVLCEETQFSRASLNRKYGPRATRS
jgi:hypothetical protein